MGNTNDPELGGIVASDFVLPAKADRREVMKLFARTLTVGLLCGLVIAPAALAQNAPPSITEQEAHAIAVDAYLYFYPLISVDITRKQSTNIEAGKEFGKGPMNMFVNVPAFPPADLKVVVRINFDTLYSIAWLDLTKEPQVVSAPDTARAILPFADARYVE